MKRDKAQCRCKNSDVWYTFGLAPNLNLNMNREYYQSVEISWSWSLIMLWKKFR